jgi:AcrR family transcriptional regulator
MPSTMSAVKQRPQALPTRRERAKATHWRIIKAAYESFCERGYAGTTMAYVAERAGVAVQTVYFVFHTKAELLSRAYDFAVMGEGEPRIPEEQAWYQEMAAEPDVTAALRHLIGGVSDIIRRVTPLYRVQTFHETWRSDGYRAMLEVLVRKAPLRPGLDPDRANHLLLLFAGPDVYHVLVDVYGWTHGDWVDWTVATIAAQVFGRAEAQATHPRR